MEAKASRLAQAGEWYLEAVDAIPKAGWGKPSLCEGWSAQHVVAHVATGDQLVRGLLLDATGGSRAGSDLPTDFADRKRRMEAALSWEPARLKETARRESEQTVAMIADVAAKAPDTVITMPFGVTPMPVLRALRLNEYIIHGYDLTPVIGQRRAIPEWFLDRGLHDSVTMMARLHQRSPHKGKSASFHIHRTDGDGEWILKAHDGHAVMEPGHAKADVAMRGPGAGLYWVVMGRGTPEEHGVELHGDPVLAIAFKEWFPGP